MVTKEQSRVWRENNPEKEIQRRKKMSEKAKNRTPWNKGKHSKPSYLSPEEYQKLLVAQNGVCAICRKPETQISNKTYGKIDRLRVDHNHKTGKIRGLLCSRCNFAIGQFQDSFDNIMLAANYLLENDEVDFTKINPLEMKGGKEK